MKHASLSYSWPRDRYYLRSKAFIRRLILSNKTRLNNNFPKTNLSVPLQAMDFVEEPAHRTCQK